MQNKQELNSTKDLTRAMWLNWVVAYGAVMLPLVFSLFAPLSLLPFVALAEVYALAVIRRNDAVSVVSGCAVLTDLAMRTLVWTAVVMIVINLLCTDWMIPTVWHLKVYNSEIPFVASLIVFPTLFLMCALLLGLGVGDRRCREYQRRHGFNAGDNVAGVLYYREARYQAMVLMGISVVMGAVELWYYFARYINANFNDPDRFFFIYMPLVVYLLTLVFMYGRYQSMNELCNALADGNRQPRRTTKVRFLIFHNGDLWLHRGKDDRWDTPAESVLPSGDTPGEHQMRLLCTELTGLENFNMRYCYTNRGFASNTKVVHYAVSIDDKAALGGSDEARSRWFNAYDLDRALGTGQLTPMLANELYRIYTMTVAWKTYHSDGRRRYAIKHYRPTFRLADLMHWDVDYDDETWFGVWRHNQDKPFYRLRRFWNRITGQDRSKAPMQG